MVTVDTIGRVRRAYWVQKKKIKAIARELRLSRGTVRRIVRSGETVLTYERKEQPLPKLGPFVEQLNKLLSGLDKGAVLTLQVRRGDSLAFVTVNGLSDKG